MVKKIVDLNRYCVADCYFKPKQLLHMHCTFTLISGTFLWISYATNSVLTLELVRSKFQYLGYGIHVFFVVVVVC